MHGEIDIGEPSRVWIIEHNEVDLMTALGKPATEPEHSRGNAAYAWIERLDQL